MDRFITDIVGKMPIVLDDFRFIDSIYRNAFTSYLKAIKADNCILHGCNITNLGGNNYRMSEGAVAINSEAFICEQQEFTAADLANCYFVIKESFDPKGRKRFADNAQHDTYLLRRVDVQYSSAQPSGSIAIQVERLEDILVYNDDSRLTDSRKCNNTFDNAATARNNLSVYSKSKTDDLLKGKANINHKHAWNEITNKPQTFPPSSHKHAWSQITNKPKTFPPSKHKHPITDISDAGEYVRMKEEERLKLRDCVLFRASTVEFSVDDLVNKSYITISHTYDTEAIIMYNIMWTTNSTFLYSTPYWHNDIHSVSKLYQNHVAIDIIEVDEIMHILHSYAMDYITFTFRLVFLLATF